MTTQQKLFVLALAFVFLAVVGLYLSSADTISPEAVRAQASGALGQPAGAALGGLSAMFLRGLLGVLLTGIVAGVAGLAVSMIRRVVAERRAGGRWSPRRYSYWSRDGEQAQRAPRVSQTQELALLLAAMNGRGPEQRRLPVPPQDPDEAAFDNLLEI